MSTRILPTARGRWVRRGDSLLLLPSNGDGELQGEVSTPVTATPAGVIDTRIDVFAQRALLRMAKSPDPATRADASQMLGAVKSGVLAGIYKEDEQVPALRARRLGSSWWLVIPKGRDAAVLREPGAAPLISFRDSARSDAARLDPALRQAWAEVRGPAPRPGRKGAKLVYHPVLGYGWLNRGAPPAALSAELSAAGWTPVARELELEEEVFFPDDRVRVNPTTDIPSRFVCCLDLFFNHPTTPGAQFLFRGTGTLIGDRHVLTAGHNLLNVLPGFASAGRVAPSRITVTPGRNGISAPFGTAGAVSMRVSPQWSTAANAQFDFGFITLDTALGAQRQASLGAALGFWSHPTLGGGTHLRPLTVKELKAMPVNLAGYPTDKCEDQPANGSATPAALAACGATRVGTMMWRSFGSVVDPSPPSEPRSMTYDLDSFKGDSGGPVWLRWEQYRNLVAVNTGGFPDPTDPTKLIANMGVRITDEVLKQLRAWMKADGASPTF